MLWAQENRDDVRGRLLDSHIDYESLTVDEAMDLFVKWWIDDMVDANTSRARARAMLHGMFGRAIAQQVVPAIDRDTWGLLPEHQAGSRRALAMIGESR